MVGWEGLYEVSSRGRVLSVRTQRLMKLQPQDGYLSVGLSRGGKQVRYMVHRLVLTAFDRPCPDGMESRHLNGVGVDNRRENLEWATHRVNISDKLVHGTQYYRDQCPQGHDYTDANTYEFTRKDGRRERHCRQCRRERHRERHGQGLRTNRTRYNPQGE